jgi:hypothetical protein
MEKLRSTRAVASGVVILATVLLAGCQANYSAHVRNNTSQAITAKILAREGFVRAERFIGPGDRARVGSVRLPSGERIWLEADSKANPGQPARYDLIPGKNVVNAEPRDDEGRIRLVEAK